MISSIFGLMIIVSHRLIWICELLALWRGAGGCTLYLSSMEYSFEEPDISLGVFLVSNKSSIFGIIWQWTNTTSIYSSILDKYIFLASKNVNNPFLFYFRWVIINYSKCLIWIVFRQQLSIKEWVFGVNWMPVHYKKKYHKRPLPI